ncbi:oligosaccharide flippase family protein, partial [Candidatus Woesearchaeota archaeon]|nr:oligosaccharide flippase family protein [Candidatus Woesearchaeota archaeon]
MGFIHFNEKKRIFKGVKIAYLFLFLITPITFFIRILFSRLLSVGDYGLFYSFVSFFSIVSLFVIFGLNSSLTHFMPKFLSEKKYLLLKKSLYQILLFQLGSGFLISVVLFLLRFKIADFYFHTPKAIPIFFMFIICFAFDLLFQFTISFFSGLNKEIMYASLNPLRLVIVFIASMFVFILSPDNALYKIVIIWTLSFSVGLIYLIIAIKKYSFIFFARSNPSSKPDSKSNLNSGESFFKQLMEYGSYTLLTGGAAFFLSQTDVVMITFFKGVEFTGLYQIALPLVTFILLFMQPLKAFMFPMVSKLYHSGKKHVIDYMLGSAYNLGFFLLAPVFVVIFSFASEIIEIFFGSKYLSAALATQILAVAFLFKAVSMINFIVLDGIGKVKIKSKLFIFGAIMNIILNLFLIPLFGIV